MRIVVAAAMSALVAVLSWAGPSWAQRRAEPGSFDYYVLSLSWSPTHCARTKAEADPDQCGADRNFGFIVHGLWPQNKDGGYPATCTRDRTVPKAVVDQTMPIMPSVGLIAYQWSKHGTCSGLGAADYFARLRAAHGKVTIPEALRTPTPGTTLPAPQVERLFLQANPGLTAEGIAVICSKRDVAEVRICMDKDLAFMPCGERIYDRCRRDAVLSATPAAPPAAGAVPGR
ncbi:ribonuclease T2 family protein [Azospirillum thermophilum]|uniref:Ribonuclease T n=1 Tax=Azospirillum thermophilum TaxID=2202148 RepID=A0A2S2CPT6_9PROT|nr:ribonuclease T2 [Azospirillum thermophilum]AWK86492.1 ribonuclease T [Azospirillum thermophilum]